MYNRYTNGSESWWAMKEATEAHKDLQDRVDEVESVMENLVEQLDTALGDREEMEEERDQLQRDLDDMTVKYETLHGATDLVEVITLITNLKVAAEAIDTFATNRLVELGALNDVQESTDAGGDGAAGDGGS